MSDDWTRGEHGTDIVDEASVAVARERVRAHGASLGLSDTVVARVVNVVSELGYNQLTHAGGGVIELHPTDGDDVPGIEVIAADRGPGIDDPTRALVGPARTSARIRQTGSLGIGLSAVIELADEVDVDTRLGEGTCVRARVFASAPLHGRRISIYGRSYPGERVSGDHATVVRSHRDILVGVADGLGHGPEARTAADVAIRALRRHADHSLDRAFAECHRELAHTRGVVLGAARISDKASAIEAACVGNITVHRYRRAQRQTLTGPTFVLGLAGGARKPSTESATCEPHDVVVLFTDGLTTATSLEGEHDLLREHPIVIAHQLVERFGRSNDDTLVLVVR